MPGLYYEQYEIDKIIRHNMSRTVTDTDNLLFTSLCMNTQPLHLSEEFAKGTIYGERLVTSVFTIGLTMGMSVADTVEGTSLGNLGIDSITFPTPVYIGDTLRAESIITDRRRSKSRPMTGIVSFVHRSYNQRDELVVDIARKGLAMCLYETDEDAERELGRA
ncbi:MaoC family dehydratase [Nocardioides sp. 31GB23]|uniref:MaoC family dehydratase n=1 Tax=Nocardioides sp. 31GB23 TaxID=3156065 RepID=UPI0032AF4FD3